MSYTRDQVITFGIIVLTLQGVFALYCFNCDHIKNARDCRQVKKCGPHEVCKHEQKVNQNGFIYRSLGCVDTQFCKASGKRALQDFLLLGKRQTEISVCTSCCNTPLCQTKQCADLDYPADRGKICFKCKQQLRFECDQIELCGRDDVCFASIGDSADGQDKLLQTGCLNSQACQTLRSAAIVGKRSVIYHNECFDCCGSDLCNFHCNKSSTASGPAVTSHHTAFTKAPCVDTLNPITCQAASQIVCKNITLATNAGCKHSCGFCP